MAKVQMTVEIKPRFWFGIAMSVSIFFLRLTPKKTRYRLIPKLAAFLARKGHNIEVLGLVK